MPWLGFLLLSDYVSTDLLISLLFLQTKYLDGYTIDLFCSASSSESQVDEIVKQVLENALPGSRLVERHGRFLRIEIRSLSSLGLGTTFRRLESLKENPDLQVENYSISQCSLEQVFIQLVNGTSAQAPDEDATVTIDPVES
jgi:hypothetical protein